MAQMICPYCRRDYPDDYKWCMDDGSELEQNLGQYDETEDEEQGETAPCPECGEPVDLRDLFCGHCAAKLEGRLPKPSTPEPAYEEEDYGEYESAEAPPLVDASEASSMPPPMPAVEEAPAEEDVPTRPCPMCGEPVGIADTFCGTCGAELESAVPTTEFDGLISGKICPHCSAGLEDDDTYCGVCGNSVEPDVAPAAAGQCPSCGMEVQPDDTFCGTCGHTLQDDAGEAIAAPEYDAVEEPAAGSGAGQCPSCGMEIMEGDTFCGTCGHTLQGDAGEDPAAPEYDAMEEPAAGSGAGQCPSCGMEIMEGDTFCGTCGHTLQGDAGEDPAAPEYDAMEEPAAGSGAGQCPSCGMEIMEGDTFCGTCGHTLQGDAGEDPAAPEYDAMEEPAAGSGAGQCPSCGMEIMEGDTFCGTCGHTLQGDEGAAEPEPVVMEETAPAETGFAVVEESDGGLATGACPSCGMAVQEGDTFCGTCGHTIQEESGSEEPVVEYQDAGQSEQAYEEPVYEESGYEEPAADPYPSISDITSEIPVCPTCGLEGEEGQTTCLACGSEMTTEGNLDHGLPGQVVEEDLSAPVGETVGEPIAETPASGEKICSCCGMASPEDAAFCGNCGVDFE